MSELSSSAPRPTARRFTYLDIAIGGVLMATMLAWTLALARAAIWLLS